MSEWEALESAVIQAVDGPCDCCPLSDHQRADRYLAALPPDTALRLIKTAVAFDALRLQAESMARTIHQVDEDGDLALHGVITATIIRQDTDRLLELAEGLS